MVWLRQHTRQSIIGRGLRYPGHCVVHLLCQLGHHAVVQSDGNPHEEIEHLPASPGIQRADPELPPLPGHLVRTRGRLHLLLHSSITGQFDGFFATNCAAVSEYDC